MVIATTSTSREMQGERKEVPTAQKGLIPLPPAKESWYKHCQDSSVDDLQVERAAQH